MSLILSTAPHTRTNRTTARLMGNVLLSLVPCTVAAVYFYGFFALVSIAISVASAIGAEYLWCLFSGRKCRINDLSAAVTGLLLALCISPKAPWWIYIVGSAFAIIIVKQLFGGIGDNFLNPALAARAVLLASWPAILTTHILPATEGTLSMTDAVTSATQLATGAYSLKELFFGSVPGAMGETCKLAILIGFVILLATKTITWRIPVISIASAFVLDFLLGIGNGFSQALNASLVNILSGGLLFGAVFMATDYTTSPMKPLSQAIYAAGFGVLSILIRHFGAYPEGVTYAILLMNIVTPLLDRMIPSKIYGYKRKKKEA